MGIVDNGQWTVADARLHLPILIVIKELTRMRLFSYSPRRVLPCLLAVVLTATALGAYQSSPLPPDVSAALDRISADSLRGHLSFIASDLLEGRNTPSRGLDIAAEYIAAQFRRAGLEPVGDDGYFQTV